MSGTIMEEQHPSATIQERLVASQPSPSEVSLFAEAIVEQELESALADSPDDAEELASGSMRAVVMGAKALIVPVWHAARGGMSGLLRVASRAGLDPTAMIPGATSALYEAADSYGGDAAAAAKGAVEGALSAAEDLDLDPRRLGSLAATAAHRAAQAQGAGAAERVKRVATGSIAGVAVRILE